MGWRIRMSTPKVNYEVNILHFVKSCKLLLKASSWMPLWKHFYKFLVRVTLKNQKCDVWSSFSMEKCRHGKYNKYLVLFIEKELRTSSLPAVTWLFTTLNLRIDSADTTGKRKIYGLGIRLCRLFFRTDRLFFDLREFNEMPGICYGH